MFLGRRNLNTTSILWRGENIFIILGKIVNMFGKGRIRPGEYIFVVQKDRNHVRLIIGRIQNVNGSRIQINGFYIRPVGLIDRI